MARGSRLGWPRRSGRKEAKTPPLRSWPRRHRTHVSQRHRPVTVGRETRRFTARRQSRRIRHFSTPDVAHLYLPPHVYMSVGTRIFALPHDGTSHSLSDRSSRLDWILSIRTIFSFTPWLTPVSRPLIEAPGSVTRRRAEMPYGQ